MPATVYLITGGARSGKSGYAQKICESLCGSDSNHPIYLATAAKNWDADFQERIRRHQADRGEQWTTIEEPLYPSKYADQFAGRVILVDCLTLWLTNFMIEQRALDMPNKETGEDATARDNENTSKIAAEQALESIKKEFEIMTKQWNATFVIVTNEIGSGTHAESQMTRSFVDVQGWLNQHVADFADYVIHMVCGQPSLIKVPPEDSAFCAKPDRCKVAEAKMLDKFLSARKLTMDARGYFLISVDQQQSLIVCKFYSCITNEKGEVCDLQGNKIPCHGSNNRAEPMKTFEGRTAKEVTVKIFERWEHAAELVSVGHAAYVGRETQRAEAALYSGEKYQQD